MLFLTEARGGGIGAGVRFASHKTGLSGERSVRVSGEKNLEEAFKSTVYYGVRSTQWSGLPTSPHASGSS